MQEILQELMKTTLEKGPQNKQFYSNLSITKSIHDHSEIQSRLSQATGFLKSCFTSAECFQSCLYINRNCAIKLSSVLSNTTFPPEILTSVLTLELLFNTSSDNDKILSQFQEVIRLSPDIQDQLLDFIVPSCGISTFNLFKETKSPVVPEDADSGHDSPITMQPLSHNPSPPLLLSNFPDDVNTTVLSLSVLLQQGLLERKPVESVVRWIISNVFSFCDNHEDVMVSFPTLISTQSAPSDTEFCLNGALNSDPVAITNFLCLMYNLDIRHEALLTCLEKHLVTTLKNAITTAQEIVLGNTAQVVSSDNQYMQQEKGGKKVNNKNYNDEAENEEEVLPAAFKLHHHSPDSLLYFLSRALTTTSNLWRSRSSGFISELQWLLVDLLDARLGSTVDACDVAMRILAGVNLEVVIGKVENNQRKDNLEMRKYYTKYISTEKLLRINNLLRKEFELLLRMQNDNDGSWPADAILQIGLPVHDKQEYCGVGADKGYQMMVGYLGGKEVATIFAIKAITAYLSVKKEVGNVGEEMTEIVSTCESDEREGLQVHHLY